MIRKFLDLSTAHLSQATRDWLDEQGVIAAARRRASDPDCMILVGSTPHGWFVYADGEACADPVEFARALERRNVLENSLGNGPARDSAVREALHDLDKRIAGLTSEPSADIPADLWGCFARASVEGCEYVLFDADAPVLDGLQTFDDESTVVRLEPFPSPVMV